MADGLFELFEEGLSLADELRRVPGTLKAEVTNMAVKLGIDAFPIVWALVKKKEGGGWELVAVSLDRALLPDAADGAILTSARLDRVQNAPK